MSEREELEWSNKRFEEIIAADADALLKPDDPRITIVKRVCDRLIQALNNDATLSCVSYARQGTEDTDQDDRIRRSLLPSARTDLTMPFLPEVT